MVSVSSMLDALKTYKSDTYPEEYSRWYCYVDKEIYNTNELYQSYGYESIYEIYSSGLYIEFPKVDVTGIEKEYLRIRLGKDYKKWDTISDNEFDIEFRRYIERNFLIGDWIEYEKTVLKPILLEWASRNGIPLEE